MEKGKNGEEMTRAVGELLEVCRNCKLYPALIPILSRILAILQEENP
jgi:hypothetical protein